jgi:hypothetical protein
MNGIPIGSDFNITVFFYKSNGELYNIETELLDVFVYAIDDTTNQIVAKFSKRAKSGFTTLTKSDVNYYYGDVQSSVTALLTGHRLKIESRGVAVDDTLTDKLRDLIIIEYSDYFITNQVRSI